MLGFIIFGWPTRQKQYGPTVNVPCERCANDSIWHLVKTRQWLTLFWIPVFPLGRADYWLTCEICGAAIELNTQQAKEAKNMAGVTERYQANEISESEYIAESKAFRRAIDHHSAHNQPTGIETESNQPIKETA